MTTPICALEVAPSSAIVPRTIWASSAALIACGRYSFKIDNSLFFFSTSSARPPFSKLSIESCRCFTCLRITCTASASSSSASAPDFSMAAYLSADLSIRRTPTLVASCARIPSFRSESTRSGRVICSGYGNEFAVQTFLLSLFRRDVVEGRIVQIDRARPHERQNVRPAGGRERMFSGVEKSRAGVGLGIQLAAGFTFSGNDFVGSGNHTFEFKYAGLGGGLFQIAADNACPAFYGQIISRHELPCVPRGSFVRRGQASAGLDASLRDVVDHELALNSLEHNRLEHGAIAPLSKNRFTFAIENVIARLGQGENVAQQVGLDLRAVYPERSGDKRDEKSEGGYSSRPHDRAKTW